MSMRRATPKMPAAVLSIGLQRGCRCVFLAPADLRQAEPARRLAAENVGERTRAVEVAAEARHVEFERPRSSEARILMARAAAVAVEVRRTEARRAMERAVEQRATAHEARVVFDGSLRGGRCSECKRCEQ
jgi:predicted metal-binding protein